MRPRWPLPDRAQTALSTFRSQGIDQSFLVGRVDKRVTEVAFLSLKAVVKRRARAGGFRPGLLRLLTRLQGHIPNLGCGARRTEGSPTRVRVTNDQAGH